MGLLVLVLEDEPTMRLALRGMLESEGHQVIEAASALQAMDLLLHHDFDVALIDWELGTPMTGAEVAKRVPAGCARIMVTAHSTEEIRAQWQDPLSGLLAFIRKGTEMWDHPKIGLKVLLQRVERSLNQTPPRGTGRPPP